VSGDERRVDVDHEPLPGARRRARPTRAARARAGRSRSSNFELIDFRTGRAVVSAATEPNSVLPGSGQGGRRPALGQALTDGSKLGRGARETFADTRVAGTSGGHARLLRGKVDTDGEHRCHGYATAPTVGASVRLRAAAPTEGAVEANNGVGPALEAQRASRPVAGSDSPC
jgi:hypothetical protein